MLVYFLNTEYHCEHLVDDEMGLILAVSAYERVSGSHIAPRAFVPEAGPFPTLTGGRCVCTLIANTLAGFLCLSAKEIM